VVHGAGLLYLLALVFILVQSENNARQFLTFFYPDLGKPPAANDLIYASGTLLNFFTLPNPPKLGRTLAVFVLNHFGNVSFFLADCRIYTPEQENHFAHVTSAWHDIFIGTPLPPLAGIITIVIKSGR
jgi:hypothetical protein